MHGWGVFPNNKGCSMQKKNICKIDRFHQNKLEHQLFTQILVRFWRNSIKYVVSRVVLGALAGALKVALLRAKIIQGAF